ncbi:hypothetical protein UA08_08469 [Talaromyces atroroseus]|uniref:Uncharacterized protein n=1 Tax=Talaromyces atroroseus TaxID=1441469 RepID=A0A1Q5Q7N7_TALAT|nr:hypothetical protein UA08_08469 [Talaromyces atroroseus]OKL56223.1 hypothetical protein UA08_08469 [Talaromyces atroroseus]
MITFRTESSNRFVLGAFKDLRLSLWKLGDCPKMRWGTDNDNASWFARISLFINLGDLHANQEMRTQFITLVEEFRGSNMEVSTFYILANENDTRAFEYAYNTHSATRSPQLGYASLGWGPPAGGGLNSWIEGDTQTSTHKSVTITSWSSQAGRTEWQNEYSIRAQTDYNRLGYLIDWLRIIAQRVETQFWVLEKKDPEIWQWEIKRNKPR